jgi:hypothetical protein
MTANELAQLIEDVHPRGFVKDAADMLRQQQAEIEALKKEAENEPVAWMVKDDEDISFIMNGKGLAKPDASWKSVTPVYTHPAKTLTDDEIIESLAELEHEQWMAWANTIMQTEKISDNRCARWASLMIPYSELSEEMKEHDRVWARKALAILRKAQEK